MSGAVVRKWEATIARRDIGAWLDTFRERAYPGMSAVEGFRGISILASRESDPCRVTVLTAWDDIASVRRYAGDRPSRAVMPDFMAPFFREYDAEATFHDQLLLEPAT